MRCHNLIPSALFACVPLLATTSATAGDVPVGSKPAAEHLGEHIVYVNFEGGDFSFSCQHDVPEANCSTVNAIDTAIFPFSGDAAERAEIIRTAREHVADFGITLTTVRPDGGDYDMIVIGAWESNPEPDFFGIYPGTDCGNVLGSQSGFVHDFGGTTSTFANIIVHQVAQLSGLEGVGESADMMYQWDWEGARQFTDWCHPLDTPGLVQCGPEHEAFCPEGQQNSYQEMLNRFGPSVPDDTPPALTIVAPADGAYLPSGDFELVVEFVDDQIPAIIDAVLTLSGDALAEPIVLSGPYVSPGELAFPITGLPEGQFTVSVVGLDEMDNEGAAQVLFNIGDPPPGGVDGDGTAGDGTGGVDSDGDADGGLTTTMTSGSEGDSGGDGAAAETQPRGCSCQSAPGGSGWGVAWGVFALLGFLRRRSG